MANRLLCAHRGDDDEYLWWCVYNGTDWSGDKKFSNGARSTSAPALCSYNGVVYCVHRGQSGNTNLWYCTFDPTNQTWSEDIALEGDNKSNDGPALAVFNNKLYCVHKGGSDNWMWWCVLDTPTSKWSPDHPFSNSNRTNSPPALIVFNNTLYCVHRGDDDQHIYWSRFTGDDWTEDQAFPNDNRSGRGVGLYIKDNVLNCVHRGQQVGGDDGDQLLYYCSTTDGSNWTADAGFPSGNSSGDGPAVAIYDSQVICVHRGVAKLNTKSDPHLFYATLSSSGTWSGDTKFPGQNTSADGPALVLVNFP